MWGWITWVSVGLGEGFRDRVLKMVQKLLVCSWIVQMVSFLHWALSFPSPFFSLTFTLKPHLEI